jgi:Ca2+-transporting ATPase
VGVADPPAADVKRTIERLATAGIRTVMVTGDQRITAEAVAADLGLLRAGDEVLDGRDLSEFGPRDLAERLERVAAFSRVSPGDKLHIVEAYQKRGEIVGMLGDGVNDAPALQRADIGVAMGGRGTDVAKETADMVLADDRFSTVAMAVEEGRVIYDNILKFIFYLFSCNVSEVLVLFVSVVAGLPLPVLPLHILWLNLVTDVFPALALAMEPAEPDVMHRPPRNPKAAILSRRFALSIAGHAALLTAVALAAFLASLQLRGDPIERARTIAFMTLALSQLLHVFNARSQRAVLWSRRLFHNPWVWAALALTVALQLMVVYLPALAATFHTTPLGADDWLLVLGMSVVPLLLGQVVRAMTPTAQVGMPAGNPRPT